jgi:hypothetical protein
LFAKNNSVISGKIKKIRFAHHILITGVDVVKNALNSWQEYNKMPSEREAVTVNSVKGYYMQ